jgi:hypothetical protein
MKRDEIIDTIETLYQNGNVGEEFSLGPMAESFSDFKEVFSARELAVLEAVASVFKNATPGEISNRSHEESAWRDTPEREIISYKLAENLSLSVPL